MKMKSLIGLMGLCIAAISFNLVESQNIAEVDQVQGIYIFVKSKPVAEYEVLGTIKPGVMGSHEFDNLLEMSIKKAKKEYSNADGILFDSSINQTHNTNVTVIKFK